MVKQAVARVEETEDTLPLFLTSMVQDAGKGVSHSQDDNIVPLIYVVQSNSSVTKKSNSNYIEGSSPGDIWKRNSGKAPIVDGEKGIIFQPCYFEKVWVEWRPNRGGFAGSHKERPADAEERVKQHEGREVKVWVRSNGNEVVETRHHIGYADGEAYVIPFTSTGHTVSRTWMQLMNQQMIPGTNKIAPAFAKKYRLTTVERSNTAGSWYVFKVEDAGWVSSAEEYKRGSDLFDAFNKGEKQAAAHEIDNEDSVASDVV